MYRRTVWGNARWELTDDILKLQKRAARLILDTDIKTPSVDMFRKLKWIPVQNIIKRRKLMIVFSCLRC